RLTARPRVRSALPQSRLHVAGRVRRDGHGAGKSRSSGETRVPRRRSLMAGIFPRSRRGSNQEAGDFDSKARAIARYVVDAMMNEGIGMSFEEAKALAAVENSDASE